MLDQLMGTSRDGKCPPAVTGREEGAEPPQPRRSRRYRAGRAVLAVIGRSGTRSPHPPRGGATGAVTGGVGGAGHLLPPRSCRRRPLSGRPRWRPCCYWKSAPGVVGGAQRSRAVTAERHKLVRFRSSGGGHSEPKNPPKPTAPLVEQSGFLCRYRFV